jgi:L,D-peptidoglycan transpeptidase YkuD (ErfK/YbiS/YcfS/YnhG family)
MKNILRILLVTTLSFVALVSANAAGIPGRLQASLPALAGAIAGSSQLLYVDPDVKTPACAILYPLKRFKNHWALAFSPVPANLGRRGMAPAWEKREGDGRTPTGIYPLQQAFGYAASVNTRMSYHQLQPDDVWVDDVQSPDYNRLVKCGDTHAMSFEAMFSERVAYRYGLVVAYNTHPVIKGLGSAIFVHVQKGKGIPTSGCVSVNKRAMIKILSWLDPSQKPQIVIGTSAELALSLSGPVSDLPTDIPEKIREKLGTASRKIGEWPMLDGFFAVATTVPTTVETRMLETGSWRPGCPVPISDLAYLATRYWGFDGKPHYGELVVHIGLADFYLDLLKFMYKTKFPVNRMKLIDAYDADDDKSMAADNTSAFNCRDITGKPGIFSKHSYGGAIDINPLENPYITASTDALKIRGWDGNGEKVDFLKKLGFTATSPINEFCKRNPAECKVLPPSALSYIDRSRSRSGMLQEDAPIVEQFKKKGFGWGGEWTHPIDYQHFEYGYGKLAR